MIKFFRKIRQKLLTENKTSKYLLYAIGEIVLVVIGILIALWINNENQNYKNRNLANIYLSDFKRDLESYINTLEKKILKNVLKALQKLLMKMMQCVVSSVLKKMQREECNLCLIS